MSQLLICIGLGTTSSSRIHHSKLSPSLPPLEAYCSPVVLPCQLLALPALPEPLSAKRTQLQQITFPTAPLS